jgi:hypothetical protein
MTDEEDPTVEALAELRAATAHFTEGRDEQERRRERLAAAIVKALTVGVRPSVIEREAPYDRQHIDRIRKAAGLPAKRAATVQAIPKESE